MKPFVLLSVYIDFIMQWPGKRARSLCKRSEEERQWEQEIIMHLSMSSRGGWESGNPRKFDRHAYPQGGDFDLTSCIWFVNFKSRWEENHLFLLISTTILCPGVGILIHFFKKMSKSPPYARPPSGLTLIGVLLHGGFEYRHPTKY